MSTPKVVTITIQNGSMSYSPHPVPVQPGDEVTFVLSAEDGWVFDSQNGIKFDTQGDSNYLPWQGDPAAAEFTGSTTWMTTVPLAANVPGKFRYTINLINPTGLKVSWDPEMENQPGT